MVSSARIFPPKELTSRPEMLFSDSVVQDLWKTSRWLEIHEGKDESSKRVGKALLSKVQVGS